MLQKLRISLSYPQFVKDSATGGSWSHGVEHKNPINQNILCTLFQPNGFMNESGVYVKKAWEKFQKEDQIRNRAIESPILAVIHDDLETQVGKLRVRTGGSPR